MGVSVPEPGKVTTPRSVIPRPAHGRKTHSTASVSLGCCCDSRQGSGGRSPSPRAASTAGLCGLAGRWPGAALPRASVVQVLLLPGGRGDGAVRVHDDLGAADDHDDQEEAEEDEAGQGQPFVHVHVDGLGRGLLHLVMAVAAGSLSGSGLTGTIFHPCREPSGGRGKGTDYPPTLAPCRAIVIVASPRFSEHYHVADCLVLTTAPEASQPGTGVPIPYVRKLRPGKGTAHPRSRIPHFGPLRASPSASRSGGVPLPPPPELQASGPGSSVSPEHHAFPHLDLVSLLTRSQWALTCWSEWSPLHKGH